MVSRVAEDSKKQTALEGITMRVVSEEEAERSWQRRGLSRAIVNRALEALKATKPGKCVEFELLATKYNPRFVASAVRAACKGQCEVRQAGRKLYLKKFAK